MVFLLKYIHTYRSEISNCIHSEHFLILGNRADMVAAFDILGGEKLNIPRTFLRNT